MLISRSGASTESSTSGCWRAASSAPLFNVCQNSLSSAFVTITIRCFLASVRLQPPTERTNIAATITTHRAQGLFLIYPPSFSDQPALRRRALAQHIDPHRSYDDHANHYLLPVRRHIQQGQSVSQDAHNERANERSPDRAHAAKKTRSADDHSRDGI